MLVLAFPERAALARWRGREGNQRTQPMSSKFSLCTEKSLASEQLASGRHSYGVRTVSARWGSRAPVFPPLPAQKSPQAQASISAPPASTSGKISS